jgi:hypothetical protein
MEIQLIMRGRSMTDSNEPGTDVAVGAPISTELATQFAQMAMMIPSETGDAVENILAAVLAAPSWEKLADPWESADAEALVGKMLCIQSLVRRPSDFRDGLGVFLVVHATDVKSGEAVTFTTGSVSVVGQLVRAYAMGWLPIYAEMIVATRQTESGYRPHHLKFLGRPTTMTADKPAF